MKLPLVKIAVRKLRRWAFARQGVDTPPTLLSRRRVYILPTRFGILYAALAFAMLLGSMNYNNSLGFALTFLLTGLGLVAMHHCHRNLTGLTITAVHGRETFSGEPVRLSIGIENPHAVDRFELRVSHDPHRSSATAVRAASQVLVELEMPAQPRGIWRLERLAVSTRFPFGLFRAWSGLHLPVEVVVYPTPAGNRPPSSAASPHGQYSGRHSHRGGSEDFRGFRGYTQGDSPRHIAWKALARGGPLLIKEYADGSETLGIFDFDSIPGRDTEARLSQLCQWIVDAERQGAGFGLKLPRHFIPVGSGSAHRRRCLTALALFDGVSNE